MPAGLKVGDFLLQPGDHFFRDEAAKIFIAGVVLLAGLLVAMVEEGERQVRPGARVEQRTENRNRFHLTIVEFAIEKEAEAMGLADRAAQQVKGPGKAGGGVGEVMFFEFDGIYARYSKGDSQGEGGN
jgi:hypothetical protein